MPQPMGPRSWQLHQSTRRGLYKLAFIAAGFLPLATAVAYCLLQSSSTFQGWQLRRWTQPLSAQLGVEVQIQQVRSRTPFHHQLSGLKLYHPETKEFIGEVHTADVRFESRRWQILLSDCRWQKSQLATSWRMIHDWFLCRTGEHTQAADVTLNQLAFVSEDADESFLRNIQVELRPRKEHVVVELHFQQGPLTEDNPSPAASQIFVKRNHAPQHLSTELQLITGTKPIPCELLSPLWRGLAELGPHTEFQGALDLRVQDSQWHATLKNCQLRNINFGQLTGVSNAVMTGFGHISLNEAHLTNEGLESALGGLVAEDGRISSQLLRNMSELGLLDHSAKIENPISDLSFETASVIFSIRPDKFQLAGDQNNSGAVLCDARGLLAARGIQHWDEALPLEQLPQLLFGRIQALSQTSPPLIESDSAQRLLRWLPLRASRTTRTANGVDSFSSLRNLNH
ncbi:MAG: hypothetical protein KDB03_00800 [Planctomycetales bacterium]|nr:hypothetical protein [Planctomycetales bacterium]